MLVLAIPNQDEIPNNIMPLRQLLEDDLRTEMRALSRQHAADIA